MGTSDELNESITGLTGLTGLTGEDASNEEVTVEEVPDNIPVDIKAKVAVSMIQLKYPLPKVHPSLPPSLTLFSFLSFSPFSSSLPSSSSNAYVFFFLQDILVALSSFPEDCGDLILDIAEAFMENGKTLYTVT